VCFLADQDVWKITLDLLRAWGHDVVTVYEIGMARASDDSLLREAERDGRLFITRDKDYGSLVFLGKTVCTGVILLRIAPETMDEVHAELGRLIQHHTEEELQKLFCTVEPKRHRIRQIPLETEF
jgi:predicted nuclease of predicted toxin-antitoxin system